MAAASANKPGIGAKRYRNTGTYGSPSWTAQNFDLSVTCNMPWDWVEAGNRATRAKLWMKARTELRFSVVAKSDDADVGAVAILAAAMSPTVVLDSLVLNGLISVEGVSGYRGEMLVNLDQEPQEADGSIYHTYELRPTFTTNAVGPSTVVMGAGSAPTFIAL